MIVVAIVASASALAVIAVYLLGIRSAAICAMILTLCVAPVLLTPQPDIYHVGIAGPVPEVRTFGALIYILALGLLIARGKSPISTLFVPLLIWLFFGYFYLWDQSPLVIAGCLQLLLGVLAFSVGVNVSKGISLHGRDARFISGLYLLIVVAETVTCALQLVGVHINPMPPADAAILGNRTNGLANHPDNLGKILIFLMLLALPLTESSDRVIRRLAFCGIFGSFLPLAMAQGRVNVIGAIMVIFCWALLLPRERALRLKHALLAGIVLVSLGVAGFVLARFDEDPTGGVRNEIASFALNQISLRPLTGTGPNNYTTVAAPITGSFIPVHDSFLLAAAELGIEGAVLVFLPVLLIVVRAWRGRNEDGSSGGSRSLVASVPAVLMIGLTGWGLLGTSVFALWFFVMGFLVSLSGLTDVGWSRDSTVQVRVRPVALVQEYGPLAGSARRGDR